MHEFVYYHLEVCISYMIKNPCFFYILYYGNSEQSKISAKKSTGVPKTGQI